MGVVVSHQFNGVAGRDVVEFHKVGNFGIGLDLSGGFRVLSPGRMISRGFPFSPFSRVSPVLG